MCDEDDEGVYDRLTWVRMVGELMRHDAMGVLCCYQQEMEIVQSVPVSPNKYAVKDASSAGRVHFPERSRRFDIWRTVKRTT